MGKRWEIDDKRSPPVSKVEQVTLNKQETPPLLIEKCGEIGGGGGDGGVDQVDGLPDKPFFNIRDLLGDIAAVFGFLLDVFFDTILAYMYFRDGLKLYFVLTLVFVIVPTIVINLISLKWYCDDFKSKTSQRPKGSRGLWTIRVICHLLGLGPVFRYLESLYWGRRSSREVENEDRQKYYYALMLTCDADASILYLIESFMETAPQLVLKLYILATNAQTICFHLEMDFYTGLPARPFSHGIDPAMNDPFRGSSSKLTVIIQVLSVTISLLSMSWSMTSHSRCNRFAMRSKKNLDIISSIVHFLWRLLTIGARVLSVALFASAFTFWCGVACAVRWIIMSAWIVTIGTRVFDSRGKLIQVGFDVVLGAVYLFAYVNAVDEPTRWKYVFYYSYEVIEDALFLGLWAWVVDPVWAWFYWPALIGCMGATVIGISLMIFYYALLHPNGPSKDLSWVFCQQTHSHRDSFTVADSGPRPRQCSL